MLPSMFSPDALAPQTVRPFSRREYDRLVELGMFEDERLELLRGVLVTMSPQGVGHSEITRWLATELVLALGRSWRVFTHSPYSAGDDSEPEPDVSVSPNDGSTITDHPAAAVLVIEVSDSSIRIDRHVKAPIYAETGVPEYWIVDISGDELQVEVHTDPAVDGYRQVEILHAGDVLRPTQLPGIEIAVSEIPSKR